MASKNSIRMVVGAGLALAAGVAFAAVSENFESGSTPTGWTGTGGSTVTSGSHNTIAVGSPMNSGANAKYYAVAGEAEYTNSDTANTYATADFLVCVTEATNDDLADPDSNARIAVAAAPLGEGETNPKVSIYTGGDWVEATSATFKLNTWQRLTLVFDYANGKCQVLLDGVPVVSSTAAYLSADATTSGSGSWYALANGEQGAETGRVASLKFVGLANIDDVVVAAPVATAPTVYGESATTEVGSFTVKLNDLAKWGVDATTINTVTLNSTAGMTVAAKLDAGLDPTSETKFNPTAMKLTGDGSSASITVPFELDTASQYYEVDVSDGTNIQTLTSAENGGLKVGDKSEGKRTLGFTIPSGFTGNVLKFTIKTAAAAPTSGN